MRRLDHRARPAAETMNEVARAVNRLNSTITAPTALGAVAPIRAYLQQYYCWAEGDWGACCEPGYHAFRLVKGACPSLGLSHGVARELYDRAIWHHHVHARSVYLTGEAEYVENYGYMDHYPGMTAGDLALSGLDGERFLLYYLGVNGQGVPALLPTGWTAETWSEANGGAKACDDTPDYLRWYGMSSDPSTQYYTGPHWSCGTPGSAAYSNWPYAYYHNLTGYTGNVIGGNIFEGVGLDSMCIVDASCTFGLPYVLQRIPDGSTILEAKLEVMVSGLSRYRVETSTTVDDQGQAHTEVVETTTVEGTSLALVAGTCEGRRIEYDVVAGIDVGASIGASDCWQVVDVTSLCQTMLDELSGTSAVSRMALVPSPYAGLVGMQDMRGYLAGLLPTRTLANYTHPGNTTDWFGQLDFYYSSSEAGECVYWDAIATGNIAISWQLPNGEQYREVMPWQLPPMH